ncbi:MAG: hypothetical protein PHV06_08775 [bacterium]|nr:hypothetical protein [bacterium]
MLIKNYRIPIKQIVFYGLFPSFIKKFIYRFKGYKIGNKVKIGLGSIIQGENVTIADHATIGFATVIKGKNINIGRYVTIASMVFIDSEHISIGEDTRIREQVYAGGLSLPDSALHIGKRCLIMQNTFLNPTKPITLGDDSAIGGNCSLFTHSSWLSTLEGYPVKFEPITIGKKVWIPWNTFITAGVTIGDNVIIGPGNVISRDIPSDSMANGNPLKIYPNIMKRALPVEKREIILNKIIDAFCKYLEYHDYAIKRDNGTNAEVIKISKGRKNYYILITDIFNKENSIKKIKYDLILFKDSPAEQNEQGRMIVSLFDLKRIGSTDTGEEFVRYFSRYGIRFERLN